MSSPIQTISLEVIPRLLAAISILKRQTEKPGKHRVDPNEKWIDLMFMVLSQFYAACYEQAMHDGTLVGVDQMSLEPMAQLIEFQQAYLRLLNKANEETARLRKAGRRVQRNPRVPSPYLQGNSWLEILNQLVDHAEKQMRNLAEEVDRLSSM